MIDGLIGKKRGMTQIFTDTGEVIPVTVIEAGPCPVIQVKTEANDGYEAVQLGFDEMRPSLVKRPQKGRFEAAKAEPRRIMREFRPREAGKLPSVGDVIKVDLFERVDRVRITGTTKGKGFQGGMKRHGFHGGRRTHGSDFHRAPGTVGCRTIPSETYKGYRMAGQMGNVRHTQRNIKIVKIDAERHLIYVKGAIPGAKNGYVLVRIQD